MTRESLQSSPKVARWIAPLALVVALGLGVTGCYTQLGASGQTTSDSHTVESAPTWSGEAAAPGARVGLNGMAQEDYVAEYGESAYVTEEYYGEADGGYYQDQVAVSRYYADDDYYDAYYGRTTYVSHHYYYPRYRSYYYPSYYSPYHYGSWASYYDPFYRPGWSFHIGMSFGHGHFGYASPYWGMGWHDPFLLWAMGYPISPRYFWSPYRYAWSPFYGGGWRHHSGFSSGYWAGWHHGYSSGWHDGYYYGGSPYAGGNWSSGRSRGPVRPALGSSSTRDRRSALAAVTADTRRLALDAPVGPRQARSLSNDTRQHVLVNRTAALGGTTRGVDAEPTRRAIDRSGLQPDVSAPARTAPQTRTTEPTRVPQTAPQTRQPQTTPQTRQPQRETAPSRSRWDSPQPQTRQGETRQPQPQTRQGETRQPQPQTRQGETRQPQPQTRQGETRQPQPQTRQAPPPRQTQPPPRQAPPPRQTQPPPPETRESPARDEQPPQRSQPAPSRSGDNNARQARPRARSGATPSRSAAPPRQRAQGTQRPAASPPPQRSRPAARPAPSSPPPQRSTSGSTRSSSDSGSSRTTRSRGN